MPVSLYQSVFSNYRGTFRRVESENGGKTWE